MSTRQLLRQLEYIAKNLKWSVSPQAPVFHDVVVSVLGWEFFVDSDLRVPYLIISTDNATSNEENPSLKNVLVRMSIVTKHEGDRFGRQAAIGGHGSWAQGDSKQKGVFEIQEKLWQAIERQGRNNGIVYMISGKRERVIAGTGTESPSSIAILETEFEALIYEKSMYSDVHNLRATVAAGNVTLTWTDPPDRYDLIKTGGIIICRKAGANPTGPTDGQIATVDVGTQTYVDTPGAGTWNYGVFVAYDEVKEPPSSATNYSAGKFVQATV